MTAATMTKAAFARRRGVDKSAVSKWIERDQIVLTEDGKVDVTASEAKLAAAIDPFRGRPNPASPEGAPAKTDSLASIRARDLEQRTIGQALKNAQMAGELVPVAAYEARLQTMIAGFCDRIGAELRSRTERLALEKDARVVRSILEEAVFDARSDMVKRLEMGAGDDGEA